MSEVSEQMGAAALPESNTVMPGSTVRVRGMEGEPEQVIVSEGTTGAPPDPIFVASPLGRALLGHRHGEQVQVQTPDGLRLVTIVDIADVEEPSSSRHDCPREV